MTPRLRPPRQWGRIFLLGWLALAINNQTLGCPPSPQWNSLVTRMSSADGRIIDHGTTDQRTTSEGQAYALFLALVWDDRARFARILEWTVNNLAQGDLGKHLPAWLWGKAPDGTWRVIDPNPASDADLWMAYTLLEAGRLWNEPYYQELGRSMAERILREETHTIPVYGSVLLPAPRGFIDSDGSIRLNPSYLPLQLLRGLSTLFPSSPWDAILESSYRLLIARPNGLQSDWLVVDAKGHPRLADPEGRIGSYAALRVYLWAGMLSPGEPWTYPLLHHLTPALETLTHESGIPERIDAVSGQGKGQLPTGLSATLLPLVHALGKTRKLEKYCRQLSTQTEQLYSGYYTQVLAMFSLGWLQGLYRFDTDGRLVPAWIDR